MLTFENMDQMWMHTVKSIAWSGDRLESRVGGCREIVGWATKLTDIRKSFLTNPHRGLSATYAAAELAWYLSQERGIERIAHYAPRYAEFANDGEANGSYGHRWANHTGFSEMRMVGYHNYDNQMEALLKLLGDKSNTRQAVVAMWDSSDLFEAIRGEWKDMPCTLNLQFLVRDGELNMITYMRSNDAWLGLPYDVFCFTGIQRLVADALGLRYGTYTHCVGSMHLYDQNIEKVLAAIDADDSGEYEVYPAEYETAAVDSAFLSLCRKENYLTSNEEVGRKNPEQVIQWGRDGLLVESKSFLNDLVYCLWHKTVPQVGVRDLVSSRALRAGLK